MPRIDISNVIRVTLLSALRGLANLNTSALAIITDEEPIPTDYGEFRAYRSPDAVAADWGSGSTTYTLAVRAFAQTPNVLSGGGYLVIIPREQSAAAQPATARSTGPIDLTALTATDYNLNVAVDGGVAADELIGEIDTSSLPAAIASLNSTAITAAGLEFSASGEVTAAMITLSTIATGTTADLLVGESSTGTDIAALLGLAGAEATGADSGVERVKDAVLRTNGAVPYFGAVLTEVLGDAELIELANTIQTMDKILFVGSSDTSDIAASTGVFSQIKDAALTQTRTLLYTSSDAAAVEFAAAYAGRALSTNFNGDNTAQTMHLKDLVGITADDGITQTLIDAAKIAGTDLYVDFGVPKVFTSGANQYFDQVYNRMAFRTRLQTAGFNFLAQTNSKIPQTEQGLSQLKNAYRQVCQRFVANGVLGPGQWTGATTFGNPEDHIRNIRDRGYFIFAQPIAQQSQLQREERIAPLVQIAAKETGAFHSSDVTVLVEA